LYTRNSNLIRETIIMRQNDNHAIKTLIIHFLPTSIIRPSMINWSMLCYFGQYKKFVTKILISCISKTTNHLRSPNIYHLPYTHILIKHNHTHCLINIKDDNFCFHNQFPLLISHLRVFWNTEICVSSYYFDFKIDKYC
jgi:hypothetical protein